MTPHGHSRGVKIVGHSSVNCLSPTRRTRHFVACLFFLHFIVYQLGYKICFLKDQAVSKCNRNSD